MLFAVQLSQLLEVVWVSTLAGVGITTVFSLAVVGTGLSAEARRSGRRRAAAVYATLAAVTLVVVAAVVAFGVHVMLAK